MAKLPVILGNVDVTIDNVAPDLPSKSNLALLHLNAIYFNIYFIYLFIYF